MPLTPEQRRAAANDVFYLAHQLFAWYAWTAKIKPQIPAQPTPFFPLLVENVVIEGQLMFYRKVHEFFLPTNPRFPDDLRCELFGYPPNSGFLTPREFEELHKRVAHPTTQQAVAGRLAYETYKLSHGALVHMIPFFRHLSTQFYTAGSPESNSLLGGLRGLKLTWDEWSSQVPESERLQVSLS